MSGGLYSLDHKDFDKNLDLKSVRPYGDTMNDGKVQLSFTLPVPCGDEALQAAKDVIRSMGLENPQIVYFKELAPGFTFFNAYGECTKTIDFTSIHVAKADVKKMGMKDIDEYIKQTLNRKIVVVGASTGTDAHTVGIDAIMNMKGFAGHYGLERYEMFEAYNLGSQVLNEDFIAKAIELKADALLVSQTVTQKNVHIKNMTELVEMLEAEGIRSKVVLVAGGARITHELAKEIGFDAGFGPNSFAEDVGAFIAQEMARRLAK
jgi:beta-lysine 5,6-aminomutase beta subunit